MDNRQNDKMRSTEAQTPRRAPSQGQSAPPRHASVNAPRSSYGQSRPSQSQRLAEPSRPIQGQRPPVRNTAQGSATAPRPIDTEHRYDSPVQKKSVSGSDKLFYTVVTITAILTLALIVAIFCFVISHTAGSNDPTDDNKVNTENNDGIPSGTSSVILAETDDMGQEYIDSMVFVGDSNTAHLRSFGVLTDGKETKQVWATASQTISLDSQITSKKIIYPDTGEEMTIAQAASLKKPQYLVISLGTNGLTYLDEEQFKYCYNKLLNAIKEVSPSTKIIIQSIYPVTDWYTGISNESINEANEWLVELAKEADVRYIDTASVLKDNKGALKEAYNSYHNDGYHINADAYVAILQYIRTHGYN